MSISIQRFAPTRTGKFGLAVDLAVLAASMVAATHGPWAVRLAWIACGLGVFWSTSSVAHHYAHAAERAPWEDVLLTVIILLSVATVLAVGGRLFPRNAADPRTMLLLALPAQALLRLTLFAFLRRRARAPRQVLIVGTGPLGRITGEDLGRCRAQSSYLSWPGESIPEPLRGRYLGEAGDLPGVLQREVFDEVYLCALPPAQSRSLQAAVRTCETFGVPFALPAYSVRLGRAHPVASRAVADGFLHYVTGSVKPEYQTLKRLLDIGGSAAALWVLFPLLLVVAALVKLTSPGTVFFRQLRVGLHGKKFHMLKFRSMVSNAEALKATLASQNEQSGPVFKMKHDPRVTPLGRVLRKYSIDELPQLVNVLRGDMTLVGPRPPVPQEVALYEPWQRRRLSVPPGLTCLWQVSGRNDVAFEDWMYLDLQYIDHWSVGQDIGLLLKTVPAVVSGRGSH
ncbi:MAG TPA: sugar transferase [Myxococcaceae bacterium]|nr:sugar transferase [Myxococcaceae bacterium]